MQIIKAAILFNVAAMLFGQQTSSQTGKAGKASALEVHRELSGSAKSQPPPSTSPLLQQYDFGAQINALNTDDAVGEPGSVKPQFAMPAKPVPSGSGAIESIPKDFRLTSDVPLNSTALEALRVSERWRGEKNSPAAGSDGRVLYSFGAGLPTVVCAPLRVCMVELQAGEKIVGNLK